jgi:hypothetical protein
MYVGRYVKQDLEELGVELWIGYNWCSIGSSGSVESRRLETVEVLVATYQITQCRNPESHNMCPDSLPSLQILIYNFLSYLTQSSHLRLQCLSEEYIILD